MNRVVFVGIDGGGGKTECYLAGLTGELIGIGVGGGSNLVYVGKSMAAQALKEAIGQAGFQPDDDVAYACLGMSGAVRDGKNPEIEEVARQVLPSAQHIMIVNDAVSALAGAIGFRPGICINSGTGSFGVGWNEDGKPAFSNGWGHLLGDEGSGYWIGSRGLTAGIRAFDRRSGPTLLLESLLTELKVDTPQEAATLVYSNNNPRKLLSDLCPCVLRCAQQGDTIALEVVHKAADELALSALAVAHQIDLVDNDVEVALAGQVLIKNPLLADSFEKALKERLPKGRIISPRNPPAMGSLSLALRSAGIQLT